MPLLPSCQEDRPGWGSWFSPSAVSILSATGVWLEKLLEIQWTCVPLKLWEFLGWVQCGTGGRAGALPSVHEASWLNTHWFLVGHWHVCSRGTLAALPCVGAIKKLGWAMQASVLLIWEGDLQSEA